MYVTDTGIPHPSGMKIRVTNMSGQDFILDVKPETKIDDVKVMTLKQFVEPSDSMKSSLYHKVVLVRTGKILEGEHNLSQEGVVDNGKNKT